jgi:predicted dehydrogenase
MLEEELLDLLVVAGPSPLHAEMVIAATEANVRGILCEKPLATNLRDADRMIAACDENGVVLMVNHLRRFEPFYRQGHQLVLEGAIGEPVSVEATWRGFMLFAGTHLFDTVHFFLNDPDVEWLVGDLDKNAEEMTDPGGSAYVRYKTGAHAFMNADARNAVPIQVDVIGSDGKIVIGNYNLELWKRNYESRFGELVLHPFPSSLQMDGVGVMALRELIRCVETGEESISSGRIARTALACCLAVHDSTQQGNRRIDFPYENSELDIPCR